MHAAFSFAYEHPKAMRNWHEDSNFVVVLAATDERELLSYWARVLSLGPITDRAIVHEPDLNDEATAFAVLGEDAGRMLSALPLCLKEPAMS